jgi:hypothetical protein
MLWLEKSKKIPSKLFLKAKSLNIMKKLRLMLLAKRLKLRRHLRRLPIDFLEENI